MDTLEIDQAFVGELDGDRPRVEHAQGLAAVASADRGAFVRHVLVGAGRA